MALVHACPGPPPEVSSCFLTRRRTAGPTFWLSRPGRPLPRSARTWPLPRRRCRCSRRRLFHCEDRHSGAKALAPLVAWRTLTLVPHRPSRNANRNVLLDPGVVLANPSLCKLRRASPWASNLFNPMSPHAPSQYGPAWYPPG